MLHPPEASVDRDEAPLLSYRPVRIILPVAPGGGSDITARAMAPLLTERSDQQVIINKRPGAGGITGMEIASRANPDVYTIVQSSISSPRHCWHERVHDERRCDCHQANGDDHRRTDARPVVLEVAQ